MPVDKLLKRVYELPSIPKVVQELIQHFSSTTANAETISKNIQSDPVIAAKVLRLANSVRYGAGRKVASLDSAVVLLGVDTLKTLVIASGVTGTMKNIPGLDMREFWRNSFMVANLCKIIAKNSEDCDKEVAFTCGMLHNIGIPLMHLVETETMNAIKADVESGTERIKAEQSRLGYDNNEVGSRLAKIWNFPDLIVDALAKQTTPMKSKPFSPYAAIIHIAEFINESLSEEIALETVMADLPEAAVTTLGVNTYQLFNQLKELIETEDDIDELLAA